MGDAIANVCLAAQPQCAVGPTTPTLHAPILAKHVKLDRTYMRTAGTETQVRLAQTGLARAFQSPLADALRTCWLHQAAPTHRIASPIDVTAVVSATRTGNTHTDSARALIEIRTRVSVITLTDAVHGDAALHWVADCFLARVEARRTCERRAKLAGVTSTALDSIADVAVGTVAVNETAAGRGIKCASAGRFHAGIITAGVII